MTVALCTECCRVAQHSALYWCNISSIFHTCNKTYCYNYHLRICLLTRITVSLWRAHTSQLRQFVTAHRPHTVHCSSDSKCTRTIPADSHTAFRRCTLHEPHCTMSYVLLHRHVTTPCADKHIRWCKWNCYSSTLCEYGNLLNTGKSVHEHPMKVYREWRYTTTPSNFGTEWKC